MPDKLLKRREVDRKRTRRKRRKQTWSPRRSTPGTARALIDAGRFDHNVHHIVRHVERMRFSEEGSANALH